MAKPIREPRTEEEAQDLKRFLERGATTSLEVLRTFEPLGLPTSLTEAVSVPFDLTVQAALAELKTDEDQFLLNIEITGVSSTEDPPVLVFVNHPTAEPSTALTDPRFVAALAFFCHFEERDGLFVCVMPPHGTFKFVINGTRAVREAGAASDQVTLDFFPTAENRGDLRLELANVQLQLVRSSVEFAQ
jgi:hypothetical protein